MLNMLGGHLHQIGAVSHQRPYRDHIAVWPECSSQQPYRMQELQPLAFLPVGPPSRHILHVSRVYQTRSDPMSFEYIVERNPIDSGGFHRHSSDSTTHQPSGHFLQIRREGREYPHRILIPVPRHGHEDFPRTDVDTCGIRLQKGTVFQRHPFSSPPPFALAAVCFPGSAGCFSSLDIASTSSAQATARSRKG